jgi:hypothetical protein
MGLPNDALIPAAILWVNPGITREEFVERLNTTHVSFFEIGKEEAWDCEKTDGLFDLMYHNGLEGLASFLNLKHSEQYGRSEQESFDPEFAYDWGQRSGELKMRGLITGDIPNFFWLNENGRYYLDPKTFELIPAGRIVHVTESEGKNKEGTVKRFISWRMNRDPGYTDLVLTAGALKHNAWKVLSRNGAGYLDDFLKEFPDVDAAYERAVWDSHTSLYAKENGMNVSEFLRARVERFRSDYWNS